MWAPQWGGRGGRRQVGKAAAGAARVGWARLVPMRMVEGTKHDTVRMVGGGFQYNWWIVGCAVIGGPCGRCRSARRGMGVIEDVVTDVQLWKPNASGRIDVGGGPMTVTGEPKNSEGRIFMSDVQMEEGCLGGWMVVGRMLSGMNAVFEGPRTTQVVCKAWTCTLDPGRIRDVVGPSVLVAWNDEWRGLHAEELAPLQQALPLAHAPVFAECGLMPSGLTRL